jgi:PDZ domain-containing secreted protein
MADMNALVRSPIVLGGAVVLVIGAAAGGYFLGRGGSTGSTSSHASTQAALAARGVCQATLDRTKAYGILGEGANLTSTDATNTDTAKRVVCNASAAGTGVTITVDVPCDDMSDAKCLKLYKVTDAKGALLFQRTKFLKPTP